MPGIAEKIRLVQNQIASLKRPAGSSSDVQIILVSKTVSVERILEAHQNGGVHFGENRVQELLEKKKQLPSTIQWHMIGSLQTNKVKAILGETVLIHSVDRQELTEEIERQAQKKGIPKVPCLLQFNLSREESKAGLMEEDLPAFMEQALKCPRIDFQGVMTIGPFSQDCDKIRSVFRRARELKESLAQTYPQYDWKTLSMGMSSDYSVAIEEGSNCVRIGSAIFGAR